MLEQERSRQERSRASVSTHPARVQAILQLRQDLVEGIPADPPGAWKQDGEDLCEVQSCCKNPAFPLPHHLSLFAPLEMCSSVLSCSHSAPPHPNRNFSVPMLTRPAGRRTMLMSQVSRSHLLLRSSSLPSLLPPLSVCSFVQPMRGGRAVRSAGEASRWTRAEEKCRLDSAAGSSASSNSLGCSHSGADQVVQR
eukprot:755467-Hanusia_phi.AAC.3